MLTCAQFAAQQQSLGRRIHLHDGIHWEMTYPFYCKPAFIYQPVERGAARPALVRSWLGYSHVVPDAAQANRAVPAMMLDRTVLDGYGIPALPQKKRNQVRRAIEQCEVRLLQDLESVLERLREINWSQAEHRGPVAGVSASRYSRDAASWRAQVRREFSLDRREWWGAFAEGRLAAYVRTYQVEGIRVIQQTRSDPECYRFKPMDALYHAVLCRAAEDSSCRRIVNGAPAGGTLDHYKEQFLFRAESMPVYSSNAWLVETAKRWRGR